MHYFDEQNHQFLVWYIESIILLHLFLLLLTLDPDLFFTCFTALFIEDILRLFNILRILADTNLVLGFSMHKEFVNITQMLIFISFDHWDFRARNRFNCFDQTIFSYLLTIYFELDYHNWAILIIKKTIRTDLKSQSIFLW